MLDQSKACLPAHGPLCAWVFLHYQPVLLSTKWLKSYSPTAASAKAGASWDASQPHRDCPVQVRPGKVQHDHGCRCGHDESLTWTGAQQEEWAGNGKAQKSLAALSPCQFSATIVELGLASCVPKVSVQAGAHAGTRLSILSSTHKQPQEQPHWIMCLELKVYIFKPGLIV